MILSANACVSLPSIQLRLMRHAELRGRIIIFAVSRIRMRKSEKSCSRLGFGLSWARDLAMRAVFIFRLSLPPIPAWLASYCVKTFSPSALRHALPQKMEYVHPIPAMLKWGRKVRWPLHTAPTPDRAPDGRACPEYTFQICCARQCESAQPDRAERCSDNRMD